MAQTDPILFGRHVPKSKVCVNIMQRRSPALGAQHMVRLRNLTYFIQYFLCTCRVPGPIRFRTSVAIILK